MDQFYDELEHVDANRANDMERRIAAAITQAENEKLEEAAAAAAGMVLKAIDDGSPRGQIAAGVAFAVRSLKTPKD